MNNLAGDDYYKTFDAMNLNNGNYTVWVNVTDSSGLSTYNFTEIEIFNSRPLIHFKELIDGNNIVDKLYNYEITAIVNEIESNLYDNVSIMLYNSIGEPQYTKWQDMSTTDELHHYKFKFDPIDHGKGTYSISVRAKDAKGYGDNSTTLIMPSSLFEGGGTIIIESDDDDDDSEVQDNTLLIWGVFGLAIASGASILANIVSIFLRRKGKTRDLKNNILKKKRK